MLKWVVICSWTNAVQFISHNCVSESYRMKHFCCKTEQKKSCFHTETLMKLTVNAAWHLLSVIVVGWVERVAFHTSPSLLSLLSFLTEMGKLAALMSSITERYLLPVTVMQEWNVHGHSDHADYLIINNRDHCDDFYYGKISQKVAKR